MTDETAYRWDPPRDEGGPDLKRILQAAGIVMLGLAILQQLRKPSDQRDWTGKVLGFVPYDLRPPGPSRLVSRWFNPSDRRLFTEHVFGIGWSVNLATAWRLAGDLLARVAAGRVTKN